MSVQDEMETAMRLLRLAAGVLPDSYHLSDESWKWAWNELSGEAQEEVKRVHREIAEFLTEGGHGKG